MKNNTQAPKLQSKTQLPLSQITDARTAGSRPSRMRTLAAQGVPRSVGMAATGHTAKKSYLNHVAATIAQLKSLGELAQDFWQEPGKKAPLPGRKRLGTMKAKTSAASVITSNPSGRSSINQK